MELEKDLLENQNLAFLQLPHTQGYDQSAFFSALSGIKGLHACARIGPSVFQTISN
jgi:hypothetical protein